MKIAFLLVIGFVALVVGAELLVRGASRLAAVFGISPLIIGLTVVAFGTSSPELAVSMISALRGQADIALGNVVGSNIFNVLLILGLSAIIVPLVVSQQLVRVDVPLMILVSGIVLTMAQDGQISRLEGSGLAAGLFAYLSLCIAISRRENQTVREEYNAEFGTAAAASPAGQATHSTARTLGQLGLIVAGLALLILGSNWLVDGSVQLARILGASELLIGLTILAAGTSLPEVATSIVAAVRGERDIAVGNVVGSNLFNLLGVLGLSAAVSPTGIQVVRQAIEFDLPVMTCVAAACLPVFFRRHLIARWEGAVFVLLYVVYTAALVILARDQTHLSRFKLMLGLFAIPLALLTIGIFLWRTFSRRSETPSEA